MSSNSESKSEFVPRNQRISPLAAQGRCIATGFEIKSPIEKVIFVLEFFTNRSEWVGRQNARRRVRFDKIFASFS